ncbi:MAG: WecB/TagA/CpsF family glycosyltransferase [Pseudomonadota bacterium]
MLDTAFVMDALGRQLPDTISPVQRDFPSVVPATRRALATQSVLDFDLTDATQLAAIDWIIDRAKTRTQTRIGFLNAHCANVSRVDWRYRLALKTCDALFPDGAGVDFAARMEGRQLAANLNGTDLFNPLCAAMADAGLSLYLLGGRPGIAKRAAERARKAHPGLRIAGCQSGYFAPNAEAAVIDAVNASGADIVLVAFGVPDQDVWLARVAPRLNASVAMGVGGLFDFMSGRIPRAPQWMRKMGMEWAYRLSREPRRLWRRYVFGNASFVSHLIARRVTREVKALGPRISLGLKRSLDVIGAAGGLLVLSPILATTAIAVKLGSKGPVLFKQRRIGQDGGAFEMLKFRSMVVDAEARRAALLGQSDRDGVTFKMKADPRITAVGRFIRRYSIDELPQLINVLKGDMSLVGPRPALPEEVQKYAPHHRDRLKGKPGLTGLWQVSGRARVGFEDMVVLDRRYLNTRSFWGDILIMLKTPRAVFGADGAY